MNVAAYVAVGSNIRPEEHIPAALDRLQRALRVTASSTFYRTAALDRPADPDFLNGVWRVETDLAPRSLKDNVLRCIENELGRVRSPDRYAPRTLDLDLLLHGNAVIAEPGLRLPDPDIRTRAFLAVPLLELAPALVLPDTGEPLASLPVARARTALAPDERLTKLLRERITA
jgi:2-amino-4-hydroxy-6-hydroxymethyldihydropteridine diphosphokinase